MKFYQRLAYYLFGFLIGCILLFTIFDEREQTFDYLPNARTLKNIRSKKLVYGPEAQRFVASGAVDTATVNLTLKQGSVDFDKSKDKVDGGILYVIEGKDKKGEAVFLEVVNGDKAAVIRNIRK